MVEQNKKNSIHNENKILFKWISYQDLDSNIILWKLEKCIDQNINPFVESNLHSQIKIENKEVKNEIKKNRLIIRNIVVNKVEPIIEKKNIYQIKKNTPIINKKKIIYQRKIEEPKNQTVKISSTNQKLYENNLLKNKNILAKTRVFGF
jgi:hypothetical protein